MSNYVKNSYINNAYICYIKTKAYLGLSMRKLMAFRFDVRTTNNLESAAKKMGLPKVEVISRALEKYLEEEVDTQNKLKKFAGSLPSKTIMEMTNKVMEQRCRRAQ